jgi:hypothetical protein
MTHPAHPATALPIHCLGDSHVSFFSGRDTIPPVWPCPADDLLPWFKTHHLGPALAFNLSRTGTRTQGRERLLEILATAVPAGATVLLSFGEIDCRAHLPKQAEQRGLPLEQVVDECLDAYFNTVAEVAGMGFRVIVYNALYSHARERADGKRKDGDYAAYGTWSERMRAVALFNTGAKLRCGRIGLPFLATLPHLTDRRGRPLRWYFFDSIHLSQRAMPIALRELAALLPESGIEVPPVLRPSSCSRLADWLDKRGRRLRKELRKAAGRVPRS